MTSAHNGFSQATEVLRTGISGEVFVPDQAGYDQG
jgi:hypothetical protein